MSPRPAGMLLRVHLLAHCWFAFVCEPAFHLSPQGPCSAGPRGAAQRCLLQGFVPPGDPSLGTASARAPPTPSAALSPNPQLWSSTRGTCNPTGRAFLSLAFLILVLLLVPHALPAPKAIRAGRRVGRQRRRARARPLPGRRLFGRRSALASFPSHSC